MTHVEITVSIGKGGNHLPHRAFKDVVHDTMHNVATQHVPRMLRYIDTQLQLDEEVKKIEMVYSEAE